VNLISLPASTYTLFNPCLFHGILEARILAAFEEKNGRSLENGKAECASRTANPFFPSLNGNEILLQRTASRKWRAMQTPRGKGETIGLFATRKIRIFHWKIRRLGVQRDIKTSVRKINQACTFHLHAYRLNAQREFVGRKCCVRCTDKRTKEPACSWAFLRMRHRLVARPYARADTSGETLRASDGETKTRFGISCFMLMRTLSGMCW